MTPPLPPLRLWWQPDTLTAHPSPSSNPGSATCFLAPPSLDRRKTTTTLPPSQPRPSKPRRSWAKALAGGRWRKLSSADARLQQIGVRLSTMTGFPSFLFQGKRAFSRCYQKKPFLSEVLSVFFHRTIRTLCVYRPKTNKHSKYFINPTWKFNYLFFARGRLCSTLCDDTVKSTQVISCRAIGCQTGFFFSPQNLIYVKKEPEEIKY